MKTSIRKNQESDLKMTSYAGIVVVVIALITLVCRYVFHIV